MASTATKTPASQTSESENPIKTLTLNISDLADKSNNSSAESAAADVDGAANNKKESGESKEETTGVVSPTGNTGTANDIEKKLRRAERFGVPVQLSEQEKRNSRAERFGVGAGSETSKTSEDLKRKARAERFGLSVSADEEAKKKARLARFGSDTKTDTLGSDTKTDTLEDEKRKARARRFSQPASKAVQHINGKEDVGSNTAIAGNTVEGA